MATRSPRLSQSTGFACLYSQEQLVDDGIQMPTGKPLQGELSRVETTARMRLLVRRSIILPWFESRSIQLLLLRLSDDDTRSRTCSMACASSWRQRLLNESLTTSGNITTAPCPADCLTAVYPRCPPSSLIHRRPGRCVPRLLHRWSVHGPLSSLVAPPSPHCPPQRDGNNGFRRLHDDMYKGGIAAVRFSGEVCGYR